MEYFTQEITAINIKPVIVIDSAEPLAASFTQPPQDFVCTGTFIAPDTAAPHPSEPDTTMSKTDTAIPETSTQDPDPCESDTSTQDPDPCESDTAAPDPSEPDTTAPAAPEPSEPDTAMPQTSTPDPHLSQSDTAMPVPSESDTAMPETTTPDTEARLARLRPRPPYPPRTIFKHPPKPRPQKRPVTNVIVPRVRWFQAGRKECGKKPPKRLSLDKDVDIPVELKDTAQLFCFPRDFFQLEDSIILHPFHLPLDVEIGNDVNQLNLDVPLKYMQPPPRTLPEL